jgi:hypothetical protein
MGDEEFKIFLGPLAKGYNDAELRQLRYEMHAITELLLDIYLEKGPQARPKSLQSCTLTLWKRNHKLQVPHFLFRFPKVPN